MTQLVERYRGQVFGLCYRMLGNREDAEDAAQETFVRVLRSLARWDSTREFEPWLLAIAGNRCRTALSVRKRRRREQPLLEPPELPAGPPQDEGQLAEEVEQGLGRLRTDYREAFVLFHEQELSYEQIAETINRPLGTVKTWIHRARRELIRHLVNRGVVAESQNALREV
jgi:RNA polymerase sigma-70 factor (ECF subfamily)